MQLNIFKLTRLVYVVCPKYITTKYIQILQFIDYCYQNNKNCFKFDLMVKHLLIKRQK